MKDNSTVAQNHLDTVEDIYEITVLLDFYGQLLTERQAEIMDLHYNSDLSLGEIADDFGISRQGVHDTIRKAKQSLAGYEERLGLVKRFREQEENIEKALESLGRLGKKAPELVKDPDYMKAMEQLRRILDTL